MTVRILHNENERSSFVHGYKDGDPLKEVYRGEHRLPYQEELGRVFALDHIFEQNQWHDFGRPWYDDARSLSVGDVVMLNDRAFAAERGSGFREVELAERII